jgi:hypothetical protein
MNFQNKINLDYTELIWSKKESLSSDFCDNMIEKFEKDTNRYDGVTSGGFQPEMKITTDLSIDRFSEWSYEDSILQKKLSTAIDEYYKHLMSIHTHMNFFRKKFNFMDTGYQIQKYEIGTGFYNWHNDFTISEHGTRILTFIWYLNDVELGGETEFIDGTKILPQKGKIVLFPSNWNFVHRGNAPLSGNKYICTGWLYAKIDK